MWPNRRRVFAGNEVSDTRKLSRDIDLYDGGADLLSYIFVRAFFGCLRLIYVSATRGLTSSPRCFVRRSAADPVEPYARITIPIGPTEIRNKKNVRYVRIYYVRSRSRNVMSRRRLVARPTDRHLAYSGRICTNIDGSTAKHSVTISFGPRTDDEHEPFGTFHRGRRVETVR